MRTIAQVQADIEKCVDANLYDQLQAELAGIHKTEVLAKARAAAAETARVNRELEERRQAFKAVLHQIDELYTQAKVEDLNVLPALTTFFESVLSRYELANHARVLEDQLEQEAKQLHETFTRRQPGLVGGANLKNSPGYLLRVFLQRYSDWRVKNHGQPPSLEMVASHGLRGSITETDIIEADRNF